MVMNGVSAPPRLARWFVGLQLSAPLFFGASIMLRGAGSSLTPIAIVIAFMAQLGATILAFVRFQK
jgi:hypothetical protein